MAKVYRYYVEVWLCQQADGKRIPLAYRLGQKTEKIEKILETDKKWSRSHEFCEHYSIQTEGRILDLYYDGWNRWYIELDEFHPALFSYQDLIRYGLLKD